MRRSAAGLVAVIAVTSIAFAMPASTARTPCPQGYLCLYRGYDFRGKLVKIKRQGYGEKIYYWMNDEGSSVKNKSGRDVTLYADFESGDQICVDSGEKIGDLGETTPNMDNTISSSTIHADNTSC